MSKEGIKRAAQAFSDLQQARGDLMKMATEKDPVDKIDLALAQLMDRGKDAMKDRFGELTLGKL